MPSSLKLTKEEVAIVREFKRKGMFMLVEMTPRREWRVWDSVSGLLVLTYLPERRVWLGRGQNGNAKMGEIVAVACRVKESRAS